jgi:hypothetical protein
VNRSWPHTPSSNALIAHALYTPADKARMIALLLQLEV